MKIAVDSLEWRPLDSKSTCENVVCCLGEGLQYGQSLDVVRESALY